MSNKKQITLTRAKVEQLKKDVFKEAFDKTMSLFLLAAHDECGLDKDQIVEIFKRADRYSNNIKNHYIGMNDIIQCINKNLGISIEEWE